MHSGMAVRYRIKPHPSVTLHRCALMLLPPDSPGFHRRPLPDETWTSICLQCFQNVSTPVTSESLLGWLESNHECNAVDLLRMRSFLVK
jgi:hypothetical protein